MLMNVIRHRVGQQVADGAIVPPRGGGSRWRKFPVWVCASTTMPPQGCCDNAVRGAQALLIMLGAIPAARDAMRSSMRKAGALTHHDVRQLEQLLPFVPGVQLQKRIAAHQQAQRLCRAQLGAQFAQRVHRITRVVRLTSRSSSTNAGWSAIASRTIALRCCADTCGASRCGGVPVGMKRICCSPPAPASPRPGADGRSGSDRMCRRVCRSV